jgi:hypothetical protein
MELFKQINYEALNEDARLKRQIRDRTFQQVAAFTQMAAEQIKPAYGVDAQNTFDKLFNNFGATLARVIEDYSINDDRINAIDVIQSYNNLSSFINAKMGFKDLSLTQRDYITQKMNSLMPQISILLRNSQAADYTDKYEIKFLLDQFISKTYNTVGFSSIRPEYLDIRGLISRCRDLIKLLENRENDKFFEADEENIIKTSSEKLDEIQELLFNNPSITGALKRQFEIKQRLLLEQLIKILSTLLASVENRKALAKKSIKEYTEYQYNLTQMGRATTSLAEGNPKLLEKIEANNQKLANMIEEVSGQSNEPYKAKKQTQFSKTLKEGTALLEKAAEFYKKIVENTVVAESPKQQGILALPKNMQAINGFTYANENPDPDFAAPSDNIIIQDLGPTPSFTGTPRGQKIKLTKLAQKRKEAREAQAVPAAEPAVGKYGEPLDEPMIGEGLRSHPSYKNVKRTDDVNPYIRMFAR